MSRMGDAIKKHCLQCCGSHQNIKDCKPMGVPCHLWEFRFGKDPSRKRNLTDEQRQQMAETAKLRFGHSNKQGDK